MIKKLSSMKIKEKESLSISNSFWKAFFIIHLMQLKSVIKITWKIKKNTLLGIN